MTRVLSLFVATFLVLSFAALAYPGKDCDKHGKRGWDWWNKPEMIEKLKLTDQQKNQIEEIASANKQKIDGLRTQAKADYEAFKELMENPNSTRDQILSKFDQAGKTHGELRRAEFEMKLDIRDVLTPEQRTALREFKEQNKKEYKKEKKGKDKEDM